MTVGVITPRYAYQNRIALTGSGVVSYDTFNPSDKSANITLSNGNLTALAGTSANGDSVRTVRSHSSGIYYCEATIDVAAGTDSVAIGIANGSLTITNNGLGADANGAGYYSDGNIYGNTGGASILDTGVTFTSGDVIGMEVDVTGAQIRVRKNGGAFSSFASCSFVTGAWFVAGFVFKSGVTQAQLTANFGATAYGTAAPGGDSNW